ncbi:hypothetical protein PoB_000025800 [Plakobranchus ocellatus]|uniref:PH domain-containing protein n=1 Tax=Plakobranchus ocellatus TaxID=259542 RepID=A0AAV3XTK0_9GAST|nr:hypothetical protein PoB_000025800 [Plakobranchus ocellatus]
MEVLNGILTIKDSHSAKIKWNKHFCILVHGTKAASPRIDIYEKDPHLKKASCKKTIHLENVWWKKIDSTEPAFSLELQSKHHRQYDFYCNSVAERREWILTLCCISENLFDTKYIVGVSSDGAVHASSIPGEDYSAVIQNDVYGGISEVQNFFVLADQSDGCLQFEWKGIYKLSIGLGCLKLIHLFSGTLVGQWQITELRNYGSSTQTMFVHSGTRAFTGEGRFTFRTTEAARIIGLLGRETQLIQANQNGLAVSQLSAGIKNIPISGQQSVSPENNLKESSVVEGQLYSNLNALTTSAAYVNSSINSQESSKQLNNTPEDRSAATVERKVSVETAFSNSSGATGTKMDKKVLKEQEKERKKKMNEDRERKKKEEEIKRKEDKKKKKEFERKKREEERKRKEDEKRQRGLRPMPSAPELSQVEPESIYTQAYEVGPQSIASTTVPSNGAYAVTDDFQAHIPATSRVENYSNIYNDPWGRNPLFSPVSETANPPDEDIYAQPSKRSGIYPKIQSEDTSYEDTDISGQVPVLEPPIWELREMSTDGNGIYAHTNQVPRAAPYDHIYGIGSASAEFSPSRSARAVRDDAGAYEDINNT